MILEISKAQAYEQIARISEFFHEHIDEYKKGNYNEHQTQFDSEKRQIQPTILHAEKEVDKLVYALYGLTEEEIAIVEGSKN